MKVDYTETEALAAVVCGLADDAETDAIERAIAEKFEISLEQFHKVIEALIPYTIQGRSALTNTVFHGFVKDMAFIVKVEVPA